MNTETPEPKTYTRGHKNTETEIKTTIAISTFQRAAKLAGSLLTLAAVSMAGNIAEAHITYSGRDFGSYSGLTNGAKAITNQTVTGNYGWADAADGILGDSHRGRAFRFHLDNSALVSLTVSANPSATTNSLGGLTPAFSIYSGLAAIAPFPPTQTTNPPSADHDFCPASVAWRIWWVQQNLYPAATDESPTDGSWNALGDWKIGGDGDLAGDFSQLSSFIYMGSAASTASGGSAAGNFALPPGDYTIFIGGNDIANKTSDTALSPYGISATFSVTPAPAISIAQKVFVAWPAGTATNWVLQSASALNPDDWSIATNTPVNVDGQPGVLLDSSAARQFFRFNYVP
jgi:hypothetical protein